LSVAEWDLRQIKNRLMLAFDPTDTGGYRDMLLNLRHKSTGHIVEAHHQPQPRPAPHHTTPHHTAPHHTTPHHTTPHTTAPHHTTPHHTTPHHTKPHHSTPHHPDHF
jgi:hypothetical protein